MDTKPTILVQLDTDALPSSFDRVVAVDAGVQHLFSYGGVTPAAVMPLVHGCIFTRGPQDLKRTAVFVGGSDVAAGEAVLAEVKKHLIPSYGLTVSVMLDSNGANTTAAAAVRAAGRHANLNVANSLVLGGTGPVGQRVARLLAKHGGHVRIGSRQKERAEGVCAAIRAAIPGANVEAVAVASSSDGPKALEGRELVIAAGAPGAVLLPKKIRDTCRTLRVAIDLNGVPPTGIEGVDLGDKAKDRDGVICYGALGVGGTKMRIHKAAITELFARNNAVLDVEEIYQIALQVQ
ncbi:NADP-dependent methylenetetrahydromethanopterin/methylenetetrahydrofolate dehydrogenase [Fimbriiglobus ruber]|uniref:Methylene tetrahydromethanopterin dehydrogenase n=1 Tax=Fimbriiglobus ruber TaxID=1908690 RepID=A0A225DQX5_9BACT|nr:NADP-dependent methylenetetrahydromethanopterin/methylenetetrahydrofolate dehydrogenase [Fimbriiglobus ruber]OWK43880.1 Methylene tetrahydromethanopterin dehydrogenase [Fimbriiglobus ruber]